MKLVASTGKPEIAMVYILDFGHNRFVESVEAVQPPTPIEKKWVLLVSTMFGCPIRCKFCDAGGFFKGMCSKSEIMAQIDFLVVRKYPTKKIPCQEFKVQFARMGEPTLNLNVLDALEEIPQRYQAPGLLPSLSTIAPIGCDVFLERLIEIKNKLYSQGKFQFQFSIHTTDLQLRDWLVPVRKWSFAEMARYGDQYYKAGDRKITLNFALARNQPVNPAVLLDWFDPQKFLIKITPLNPTHQATQSKLTSYIDIHAAEKPYEVAEEIRKAGYQVIVSIGEREENRIGSNCGQYLMSHIQANTILEGGYVYPITQY